jgi:ACR3 family arsenite efflux pump ArsB
MATIAAEAQRPGIGTFERYLSVWVALCIVAGIGLGYAEHWGVNTLPTAIASLKSRDPSNG